MTDASQLPGQPDAPAERCAFVYTNGDRCGKVPAANVHFGLAVGPDVNHAFTPPKPDAPAERCAFVHPDGSICGQRIGFVFHVSASIAEPPDPYHAFVFGWPAEPSQRGEPDEEDYEIKCPHCGAYHGGDGRYGNVPRVPDSVCGHCGRALSGGSGAGEPDNDALANAISNLIGVAYFRAAVQREPAKCAKADALLETKKAAIHNLFRTSSASRYRNALDPNAFGNLLFEKWGAEYPVGVPYRRMISDVVNGLRDLLEAKAGGA